MLHYGLIYERHLYDFVLEVCKVLGHGSNNTADILILGTIAQETHLGSYKDPTPTSAGQSIAQFDEMPFYDVRDRTSEKTRQLCIDAWGIDIKQLRWEDIWYNPFLAVLFVRLKYRLIPDAIPEDNQGMAEYYKKWYNSYEGKATPEEYLENYDRFVTPFLQRYDEI